MPDSPQQRQSLADVEHYLDLLFPDIPDDAWIVVSWMVPPDHFTSRWFLAGHRPKLVAFIRDHATTSNVYLGLGARHPGCSPRTETRGTSDEVFAIGGVWIEFDHNAGVHSATNLPSPQTLQDFIATLPFQFSLMIDSGGGVHAYLLFKELWIFETEGERQAAAHLLKRFQRTIQMQATKAGWKIDNTADLARVLRPPGTLNFKQDPPIPVTIWAEHDRRYNPSDLADALALVPLDDFYTPSPPSGDFPLAQIDPIAQRCPWLRHCHDDAQTLPEPEWYAMLSIVGRCEEGVALAHEWSEPYPGYDREETTDKLDHALTAAGPRTCAGIRYDLQGEEYCARCPSWDKIKSPIVLGMPRRPDPITGTEHPPLGFGAANDAKPVPSVRGVAGATITAQLASEPWRDDLFAKKNKELTQNVYNLMQILANHAHWQAPDTGLWWDSVRGTPMCGKEEVTDHLLMTIAHWFGERERLPITSPRLLEQCVIAQCQANPRDLLQLWLNSLPPWDGVPRLTTWFSDITGIPVDDYVADLSRVLPVSMVARALDPGCHYRYVVILGGPEALGKSSLVRALASPEWFVELSMGLETKEAHMMLQGTWVAELADLDSMTRTEETRLKAFITMRQDSYIPKYSNFRQRTDRRTIFVGTTNDETYFKGFGNTRFLPIHIAREIDLPTFLAMRTTLFAEALHYYHGHPETWWVLSHEAMETAKEQREQRRVLQVYEHPLHEWLEYGRFETPPYVDGKPVSFRKDETSWPEIAQYFLRLDSPEKWKDRSLQMQIGASLKGLGWEVKQAWRSGRNMNVWRKPGEVPF